MPLETSAEHRGLLAGQHRADVLTTPAGLLLGDYGRFFFLAGCNGSRGYWQSLTTLNATKESTGDPMPHSPGQVPIHCDHQQFIAQLLYKHQDEGLATKPNQTRTNTTSNTSNQTKQKQTPTNQKPNKPTSTRQAISTQGVHPSEVKRKG